VPLPSFHGTPEKFCISLSHVKALKRGTSLL